MSEQTCRRSLDELPTSATLHPVLWASMDAIQSSCPSPSLRRFTSFPRIRTGRPRKGSKTSLTFAA